MRSACVGVSERDASHLYAFISFTEIICIISYVSHDGKVTERGRLTRRLPFHSEEKRRAAKEKNVAREKNVVDERKALVCWFRTFRNYVGLGRVSLRFFTQKRRREERERQAACLATTWLSNLSSAVVRFVPLRCPRVSRRAVLLFEVLFAFYYFIQFRILRSSKSRTATTFSFLGLWALSWSSDR